MSNKNVEAPATHPKCNLAADRRSPWDLFATLSDAEVQMPEVFVE